MRFLFRALTSVSLLLTLGCESSGARAQSSKPTLIISAAVSLKDAFMEIGRAFEAQEQATATFNFGASNLLQRQIETGAPADIFASAAAKQMDQLEQKHLILSDTRKNFAGNTLVLIVPQDSPLKKGRFEDLGAKTIQRIALGGPDVPVRIYSEEVLKALKLWETIQPKCVFGENVRQVLDYVARGEVDAGLVYATDAATTPKVRVLATAKPSWHQPIVYPIAVVADSKQAALATRFIAVLMSKTGQQTLRKYGFATP